MKRQGQNSDRSSRKAKLSGFKKEITDNFVHKPFVYFYAIVDPCCHQLLFLGGQYDAQWESN